jgi:hypothetical protein
MAVTASATNPEEVIPLDKDDFANFKAETYMTLYRGKGYGVNGSE